MNSNLKKFLVPASIILGGVLAAGALIASGDQASKGQPELPTTPVKVQQVSTQDIPIPVRGTGVVVAAQQIALVPQVSGKIVSTDDRLMPGGRFSAGEVIATIDSRDYRALLDQEKSRAQQAELELALEVGRSDVAAREWEMVNSDGTTPSDLALRKPHRALAEQQVVAANGALRRARLNVERTRLEAPFNAIIVEESIDIGQVVGPGTVVAQLVGTDQLWVSVSLPMANIDVLQFEKRDGVGSSATIIQRLADGRQLESKGHALQLGGTLDTQTRLAQVTVAIDNPFDNQAGTLPLLPGAYVEVIFEGLVEAQAVRIPRAALYDGSRVWVSEDNKLSPRDVTVAGGDDDFVLVSSGLNSGDELIVSSLSLPLAGTPVVTIGGEE